MRRSDPPIDRLILCSNSYYTVGRTRLLQEPQEYFYDIRLPIRHCVDEAFSSIPRVHERTVRPAPYRALYVPCFTEPFKYLCRLPSGNFSIAYRSIVLGICL